MGLIVFKPHAHFVTVVLCCEVGEVLLRLIPESTVQKMFLGRRFWGLTDPNPGEEHLDRPLSNFDVIGIPTGTWSTSLFACHENVVPSCVLSFFCPCIMWAQIVVRAQIPLLIGLKNTLECMRTHSGYGAFIDYFMGSVIISAGLIIILVVLASILPNAITILFSIIVIVIMGTLLYLLQHTRRAFREKYTLPSLLSDKGASFWEELWDGLVMLLCLPCALGQMARHVFQYDHMDAPVGLYFSDPTALPPLRPTTEQQQLAAASSGLHSGAFERPALADEAGLGRNQPRNQNTGAAHRQQAIEARQRQEILRDAAVPTTATASAPPSGQNNNNNNDNNNNNNNNNNRGGAPVMAEAHIVR